jgi:hypothetical protein
MALVGSVTPAYGAGQPVTNNVQSFDLAGSGLLSADYVRITSTATTATGSTPGGEIDALEAVNFVAKARRLTVGSPLTAGGVGTIVLTAPSHIGDLAITAPSGTPPLPPGAGLPLGSNIEFRLDITDPVLNFVLFDPQAAALVSGTIALVPGSGSTSVGVVLPFDPNLIGLVLYWQSGLIGSAGTGVPTGVSNICQSRIQ